jgi:sporulation protein YlmC with PRC-barrel domain
MAHFGTLKSFRFSDGDADDIRGATIYGLEDEKLGKIDDVIFDHSTGAIHYAVIDTGGWLSSKKFVIPSAQLTASAKHEGDYQVSLNKGQIEKFPAYNDKDVEAVQSWSAYEDRYKKAWHDGPVQHRSGSDRDVTPTPDEIRSKTDAGSALTGSRQPILDVTPDRIVPPGGNEVEISVSGAGIGPRWLTFEDRLRQRRRDIILGCTTCNRSMASETASDRERDAQRKAS